MSQFNFVDNVLLYRLIFSILVFLPVFVLFYAGPDITRRRLIYGMTGILTAAIIGVILYFLSIDTRFSWPSFFIGRLVREIVAAFTEELLRYPGILLAQFLAFRWLSQDDVPAVDNSVESVDNLTSRFVEGDFTTVVDPHGMALYFGTFYGMGETIAFYLVPAFQDYINGELIFDLGLEVREVSLRITAVMAHIALTYLAMAITTYRGYWRITILLHIGANSANRIFTELNPNYLSLLLFIVFTRFAIVLIAYYLLRPRVRYLSPAVLILLLVTLFLLTILVFTFIALLIGLLTSDIAPLLPT